MVKKLSILMSQTRLYPLLVALLTILLICCLVSSVSALVRCTSPCECLTEAQAKEKFGSYVKCSEDVCGYYESAVAKLTINKYCYRELD
ncbi:MAG: hypothetical protein RQ758_08130, partial [Methanomicrobiaceae archaeon]|nr:hypothetical protein [Methanomicrobiaceae archaeon]